MKHRHDLHEQASGRPSECGPDCSPGAPDARRTLSSRAADEDGSLVLFGLILMLLMAMMGGIAVDAMRYEERRATLQSTIDRSVLAAASLSQARDPKAVVEDYFDKAGVASYLKSVTVDEGLNYRDVKAKASAGIAPFFLQMIGIDNMTANVDSRAEQRISNVEVSMVLDVSGSMGGSRINNLRPAAKEFISTVLASSDPGKVSISIVPYNAQVNIGPDMMAQYNVTQRHANSFCVELPDDVFSTTTLDSTRSFVQNAHFDPWSGYNDSSASSFNCSPLASNQVMALNSDATELRNRIDNMAVGGNTSIDLGVKWGAVLLDSGSQSVVQGMVDAAAIPAAFTGRPLDPAVADVMKVLVVMTDGENTTEYKINDPYNYGLSPVFRRNSDGRLSAYFPGQGGGGEWVYSRYSGWRWVTSAAKDYYDVSGGSWIDAPLGGLSGATQLTWPEVWARYPVQYIARQVYSNALGESYATWYYRMISYVSSTKDSRLQQACNAAKAAGIVVYGIGFEAPSNGRAQVRDCATSPAHYFDASGLEISSAFRAIASNISQLRLTQ